ncbi:SgrR family transcriptional regulator [Serratia entomophila]|jgi:MarR-like DNA-binding transcriptional regulator SgrR of sgrS sRNA|uniref:SgrR family transcriptional regulator n=1 Tax=Serratia entomophila TaxID=42906 RepID=UPI0021788DB0|nr:SgrR family transcriptional regulator [Serratia entomophila]CAI0955191.1 HTH-type transcriptional regulator sgrR [Serratia entomophila]CAI1901578.1 HTH-type transcriptional regulator sgrR [Serratia entomophila]
MRLVHRLSQYQRLHQRLGSAPVAITIGELAAMFYCSERHARTLVQQLQEQGWLSWQSQPGRGKRARLHCLKTPDELRAQLLQQLLLQGNHQGALEMAQLDPQRLQGLLSPHLGGQWQAGSPTLRIPYYRTLENLDPLTLTGRAEQHLVSTLHAGLTRLTTGNPEPQPDLAHHWQIGNNGRRWQFFLRSRLRWHNGDPITGQQLLQTLEQLRQHPRSQPSLANVASVSLPHPLCIQFDLQLPDYWLAHRLAELPCLLTHPELPAIGAGPFKLALNEPHLVRLEQHAFYHLQHPYLENIEYWITPDLPLNDAYTSCQHPVRITIGQQEDLAQARPVQRSMSLGWCYLAVNLKHGVLNQAQGQKLLMLIQQSGLLGNLPIPNSVITPSSEMLPGWRIPQQRVAGDIALPAKLTLLYRPPVELESVTVALQQLLAQHGCELELRYSPGKRWQSAEQIAQADLLLADNLIGEAPEATLESWLRQDTLWRGILTDGAWRRQQETLQRIQQLQAQQPRFEQLKNYYLQLMRAAIITPLFHYQYQISAPPRIHGVTLTAHGWFDFCQAWLPPPVDNPGPSQPD